MQFLNYSCIQVSLHHWNGKCFWTFVPIVQSFDESQIELQRQGTQARNAENGCLVHWELKCGDSLIICCFSAVLFMQEDHRKAVPCQIPPHPCSMKRPKTKKQYQVKILWISMQINTCMRDLYVICTGLWIEREWGFIQIRIKRDPPVSQVCAIFRVTLEAHWCAGAGTSGCRRASRPSSSATPASPTSTRPSSRASRPTSPGSATPCATTTEACASCVLFESSWLLLILESQNPDKWNQIGTFCGFSLCCGSGPNRKWCATFFCFSCALLNNTHEFRLWTQNYVQRRLKPQPSQALHFCGSESGKKNQNTTNVSQMINIFL